MARGIASRSTIAIRRTPSFGLTSAPTTTTMSPPGPEDQYRWNLRRILHPHDPAEFLASYFGNKPLLIQRGESDYYAGLMSLADVDRLLSSSSIRQPLIRLARSGSQVPLHGHKRRYYEEYGALQTLYSEYRAGASIILDFVHERWAPLATLTRELSVELSAGCQVNAYLTPPGSAALKPHYDSHDVFVLQTSGSKAWRIYENGYPLPLPGQEYEGKTMSPGECTNSFTLEAGDLLYLPRGYVHEAMTTESISLHLAVGVIPVTWGTMILGAIEEIIETRPQLRESLPPGFALRQDSQSELVDKLDHHIAETLNGINSGELLSSAIDSVMLASRSPLGGHLLDLQNLDTLAVDTTMRRRPGIQWRLLDEGDSLSLRFSGKAIDFPLIMSDAVRVICSASDFRAQELPGVLDEGQRLSLVRRLVQEGFVTFAG